MVRSFVSERRFRSRFKLKNRFRTSCASVAAARFFPPGRHERRRRPRRRPHAGSGRARRPPGARRRAVRGRVRRAPRVRETRARAARAGGVLHRRVRARPRRGRRGRSGRRGRRCAAPHAGAPRGRGRPRRGHGPPARADRWAFPARRHELGRQKLGGVRPLRRGRGARRVAFGAPERRRALRRGAARGDAPLGPVRRGRGRVRVRARAERGRPGFFLPHRR